MSEKDEPVESYFRVWKKSLDFAGRARRREFWTFILIHFIVVQVLAELDQAYVDILFEADFGLVSTLYVYIGLLPSLAVTVRRLHDTNCSGWTMFLLWVPFGMLALLILLAEDSHTGSNRYGPNPKNPVQHLAEVF